MKIETSMRSGGMAIAGTVFSLLSACAGGGSLGAVNIDAIPRQPVPAASFKLSGPNPFHYVTWGPWAATSDPMTGLPNITGTPTPSACMPLTGTAAYAGRAIGASSALFGSHDTVQGTVSIQVNFPAGAVDVSIANSDGRTLNYGAFLDRTAGNGNSYSGYDGNPYDFSLSGGRLDGTFCGPNAQETAGTYSWGTLGYSISGSFGAKLCAPGAAVC